MSDCQCGQSHGACTSEFQYAVKIVCGQVNPAGAAGGFTPVAPGQYWTAINIHNPDKCRPANYRWKIAVALPGQPGPVPVYQDARPLDPDMAIEIDNEQILKRAPFVKGYAVIESDIELDVVAVYTSSGGPCGGNSFATERVAPRVVPVCEDLLLPLHTGLADWRTVSPSVGPVAVLSPPGAWTAPHPFGASWVSEQSADGTNASAIVRSYSLCFDLCFGFTQPPAFQVQAATDDHAQLLLNGSLIGSVVGFAALTTLAVPTNWLRAGNNCFQMNVTNSPSTGANPTGFILAGFLRVPRGKCPCHPVPLVP